MGFFMGGTESKKPLGLLLPKCGQCGLFKTCKSPKMKPTGKGKKKILIVGEHPSESDDQAAKQFAGATGTLFRNTLRKFDLDPNVDCRFTNALICHSKKEVQGSVNHCRPNLIATIKEMDPDVIIPLGSKAVQSLIGWVWKEDWGQLQQWIGWQIPCQKPNAWICPTWHPEYVEQQSKNPVVKLLWERHLKAALSLSGKPYRKPPNFVSECKVTFDTDEAINTLRRMCRATKPVAFDFETDRIKPDHEDAKIYCCSVSDGKDTLSFPWTKQTKLEMGKLLMSNVPKIGYNIKFEDRWVRRFFNGEGVNNWWWDGQCAAHILDNRDRITSLKFQAFVQLGAPEYDAAVKPYLRSVGDSDNSPNRIRELDPTVLMTYNSVDSFLEWHIAMKQREKLGYDLAD